jgi:hypothetical protein
MTNLKNPTAKKQTQQNAVGEQPQAPLLSKQQQAAIDNANTQTKNDGSHIQQQRAARLAKAEQLTENK